MHDVSWSSDRMKSFRSDLLKWYRRHARRLPWRETRDPYRVWVSEIMLQQTQVATVEDYFRRFTEALPTVADLAAASEATVLRLWEGLGYYRRAKQMREAARHIVAKYGGRFPETPDGLLQLPGVGRYTAGAILSIAFNQPRPVVEANTTRVYARLMDFRKSPYDAAGQRALWSFAETVVGGRKPGTLNQALMELGSIVCRPKSPDCPKCPVRRYCAAHQAGTQSVVPMPKPKTVYVVTTEVAAVVLKNDKLLLRHCGPGERWEGLWDVPRFSVEASGARAPDAKYVAERLDARYGVRVENLQSMATIRHGITKLRITLHCYCGHWIAGRVSRKRPGRITRWVSYKQIHNYPLSSTGRKIVQTIPRSLLTDSA